VNGRVSSLLELTAGFDPEFTGRENVHLRGQLWGLDKEEIAALERQVVEFADIGVYMDQPMRTYSSGMKARVGFAIASSINPDILVVDEALSVGDKAFRQKCDRRIKEIMAEENVTVIFVTHSSGSAEAICSRGIVLEKGKLAFDGPIRAAIEFYEGPPDTPAPAV
jgi:teichoic acid transport system ATP-binding protein